ncbi:hypothetical protein HF086_002897 [Spodoptera exigua]|uniref:V(D)J recombination-activating protein 1 RNase H domain-containing protein n=1 Tax=Spodoptera exigua TaxID=7107 RepID=A0A922M8B3_SPOEX|nr:hypothetical protein HF086_002897 [Spodoptera exigua]
MVTVLNFVEVLVMDFTSEEKLYSINKIEFFEEWLKHEKDKRCDRLFEFISTKFNFSDITEECEREIKMKLASISSKIATRWVSSGKSKERFLNKNKLWLEGQEIEFCVRSTLPQPSTSTAELSRPGRPRKDFEDASFKTKKRRVEDLVQSRSVGELMTAAETRKWTMKVGHHVFPSYECIVKAKKGCYPSEEHIVVTQSRAEIELQAILNKTAERLIEAQREVVTSVLPNISPNSSFTLISKWGCDGSSGHSAYKQRFENSEDTDEFLFVYSFVPLRLIDEGNNIIWQNPRPSSTIFCRPIKFIFVKETMEMTKIETNKVLEQINNLEPTSCDLAGSEISVKHKLLLTMTDGKVCNALTETHSSQKCYICGATPTMMNDEGRHFDSNQDNFGFGLSTLHAWIRSFECFLHISYKLDIKKWQARSSQEKASVKQRSDEIKQRFKHEMGLIVDKPKPGFGSTNDGNTARRFFGNPELSARITGLDVTIIKNFDVLLRTLDLLNMLIITSDPLINSLREVPKKKSNKLCAEVLKLIIAPTIEPRPQIPSRPPQNEEDYLVSESSDCESDDSDIET